MPHLKVKVEHQKAATEQYRLEAKKARRLNSTFKTLHRVKGTVCMDPADQAQFWVNLCSNQLHKCTSVIFVKV